MEPDDFGENDQKITAAVEQVFNPHADKINAVSGKALGLAVPYQDPDAWRRNKWKQEQQAIMEQYMARQSLHNLISSQNNQHSILGNVYGHSYSPLMPNPQAGPEDKSWREAALRSRLRLHPHQAFPFDHLTTAYSGGKVFVFVATKGTAVTLEDDEGLYPSDALITQIRLLG